MRAAGDQRSLGRRYADRHAGFSPGGFSDQTGEADFLKYLADVGSGTERSGGFTRVRRR